MPMPVFDDVEPPASCGCEECARRRLADAVARDGGRPAAVGAARVVVLAAAVGTALSGTAAAFAAAPAVPAAAQPTGQPPRAATATATAAAAPAAPAGTPVSDPAGTASADTGSAAVASPGPVDTAAGDTASGSTASSGTQAGPVAADGEAQGDQVAAVEAGQGAADAVGGDQGRQGLHTALLTQKGAGAHGTHAAAHAGLPAAPLRLTRGQILARAETWVAARVPYSMTAFWKHGYRQDCSGFVSMAWGLDVNAWTGDLHDYAVRITKAELQPGDILLFHNRADPRTGSHVVVFAGWTDAARTHYTGYEQTLPGTRVRTIPYAYWSHSSRYLPYRYKYLAAGPAASAGDAFPGAGAFGPGADNSYVARLGSLLVGRGARAYYRVGPGSAWGTADRRATRAFQRAQGWTGPAADGLPGPTTWQYLVHHHGKDVGAGSRAAAPVPHAVPHYPGPAAFRPGRSSDAVLALGRALAGKGFGGHYRTGPSRTWSEADRRNVEAFQRAQGWSGRAADGHPGPETWRRLFS